MKFLKNLLKLKRLFPKRKTEKDVRVDLGAIYAPVAVVINERASGKKKEIYHLYLGIGGSHLRSEVLERAKAYFDKEGIECFTIRMATEEEKLK
jgi:dimeric dUTPase (all-alpha-NTP-PPase superfamily)